MERVEALKREGRWGFRQPRKQRGVGGTIKTHWDHLMDEMVSLVEKRTRALLILHRNGCGLTLGKSADSK